MRKSVERLARRIVPSTSLLSHNALFKFLVDTADLGPRLLWKDFRKLPPNHMRIRIGSDSRVFSNQPFYLRSAESFWLNYMSIGAVKSNSTIVDIGCGCGRFAHHMRDFDYQGIRFTGRYIGVDIDPEMLQWCRNHFDADRFQFLQSTHASKSYNQTGGNIGGYTLPIADGTVDFVFSTSLFSHLLEPELRNYLKESLRVMKRGATIVMSFFCLDYPPPTYGGRHTFSHRIGNAAVESLKVPEAAVAYTESFMVALAGEVGFSNAEVIGKNVSTWQKHFVARK
jgi:SAM-dependent methyltransferase